jgi:hypothetical protein
MRRTATCLVILATSTAFAACAGNPQPGESGYAYNLGGSYQVVFLVDGTPYRGTMALATALGGDVSGSFIVTEPARVEGGVEGALAADSFRFEMPYEILDNGCVGTVSGTAVVSVGGGGFDGPIGLDDSCGGDLSGTITVTR